MHERENALNEWLALILNHKDFVLSPLAGDASFRRYFRLKYNDLSKIVMDAPPGKEDLDSFVRVAKILSQNKVLTPEILAIEPQSGFLLMSDLGDTLLLDHLQTHKENDCYDQAISTLFKIQQCPITDPQLPFFDKNFMLKEMNLCSEWFFQAHLSLKLPDDELSLVTQTMEWIATEVACQPLVFIHRDYHSRNLMILEDRLLGVIDFQDAMKGPLTYDLVSLLKDCYISWPREKVLKWVESFHANNSKASHYTLAEFIRAFDLCGLQRHLKVLGVFCRLYLRDNKAGYLKDLPQTLKYVTECTEQYEELYPFLHLLKKRVL